MEGTRLSLTQLQQHFSHLFGPRNVAYLDGLSARIVTLGTSVSDLQDAIRRAPDSVVFQIAFARIVSRIFCIVDHFNGHLQLANFMALKYPAAGCGYCHKRPCTCGPHRREHSALPPDPAQVDWTLGDWCRHINELYGEKNRTAGIENVLNRLFREVNELQVEHDKSGKYPTPNEAIREMAFEIADALAWTITCAYLLQVNLEQAVLNRYGDGCTSCNSVPCSCGPFTMELIDWEKLLSSAAAHIRAGSHELPR